MTFITRQATRDDVDLLVSVYLDAFTDEIFSRQMFPRDAQSTYKYWKKCFTDEFDDEASTFFLLIDTTSTDKDGKDGKVVGFIKWVSPEAGFPDFDEEGYPEEGYPEIASNYYKELFAGRRRNMEGTRHWYLDMMGVRQANMGKGGANLLMSWGFEQAKKDGVPCFVEATGQAKTYYERFGFKEIDRLVIDTPAGQAETIYMLRPTELNDSD